MKKQWTWMPHAAHMIVSSKCQFHLATVVGDYLVSTIGEYWPERGVREIHAEVYDLPWLAENRHLKGDTFDRAYMKRFGFEEIGAGRKYETMVFKARKSTDNDCAACPYVMDSPQDLDSLGYNEAGAAYAGHMAMCKEWSDPEKKPDPEVL